MESHQFISHTHFSGSEAGSMRGGSRRHFLQLFLLLSFDFGDGVQLSLLQAQPVVDGIAAGQQETKAGNHLGFLAPEMQPLGQ